MATRHSKTKARRSRNSSRASAKKPAPLTQATLKDAIAAERRQLQRVHSLLGCIAVAFDCGTTDSCDIHYADAIELARFLVGETANRLDSVNLLRSRPVAEE